jgi:hypothetical protein
MTLANRNITESLVRKLATAHDHIEIDPSPIRDVILDIIGNYERAFAELELWREGMIERLSAYQPTARAEKTAIHKPSTINGNTG